MNNLEKKLDALIDALGFDVEVTRDFKELEISESEGHRIIERTRHGTHCSHELKAGGGDGPYQNQFKRGENNSYFRRLKDPVINYKLTKKACENPLSIDDEIEQRMAIERYQALTGRKFE